MERYCSYHGCWDNATREVSGEPYCSYHASDMEDWEDSYISGTPFGMMAKEMGCAPIIIIPLLILLSVGLGLWI